MLRLPRIGKRMAMSNTFETEQRIRALEQRTARRDFTWWTAIAAIHHDFPVGGE